MNLIAKLGTNAIFDSEKQKIRKDVLEQLAKDAQIFLNEKDKNNKENQLIIVTSGAVGCGKKRFNKNNYNETGLKQAQASVGQPILMQKYISVFNRYSLEVSQFLLTYHDLVFISGIKNIKQTYEHLKNNKIIPIVNENDVTATAELRFGDNDALTTQLAIALNFDTIINYTKRGALIKKGEPIKQTNRFYLGYYDKLETSGTGFGGLKSKLKSAKKAVEAGKTYIIAKAGDSFFKVLSQEVNATKFYK